MEEKSAEPFSFLEILCELGIWLGVVAGVVCGLAAASTGKWVLAIYAVVIPIGCYFQSSLILCLISIERSCRLTSEILSERNAVRRRPPPDEEEPIVLEPYD